MLLAFVLLLSGITTDVRGVFSYASEPSATEESAEDEDEKHGGSGEDTEEKEATDEQEDKKDENKSVEDPDRDSDKEKTREDSSDDHNSRDNDAQGNAGNGGQSEESQKENSSESTEASTESSEEDPTESPTESSTEESTEETSEHEHVYEVYISNEDGTHYSVCSFEGCEMRVSENCVYDDNGKCVKCGYEKPAEEAKETESENEAEEEKTFRVLTYENVRVEGYFPENTTLDVREIDRQEAYELLDESESDREVLLAYDITLYHNGIEYQPDDSVKVFIDPPVDINVEAIIENDLEIVHVKEDEKNEIVDLEINKDGDFEFEAESFSPWVVTVNGESVDYVERTDKTFKQKVILRFNDASLIRAGDRIRVSLSGNVQKYNVKTAQNTTSTDPIAIETKEVEVRSSDIINNKATITIEFNNIPAYVVGKTGNAQNGGTGQYIIRNDFYGVTVDKTAKGYLPVYPTNKYIDGGIKYALLSPVKDQNDAKWTSADITIDHDKSDLIAPAFNIEWLDNRNYADKRPFSSEENITPGKEDDIAAAIGLYYKEGNEYIEVPDDSPVLVKAGSNHPEVTATSFSTWKLQYEDLPQGQWYIKPKAELFGDENSGSYRLSGTDENGYLGISDTVTRKITYTYMEGVTGRVEWRISGNDIPVSQSHFMTDAGMKLFKVSGNSDPVEIPKDNIEWSVSGGKVWTYTVRNLPLYTDNGDAITYYTKMSNDPYTYSHEGIDTKFKFTYDNGSSSTETDKCYAGGTIYATVTDKAEFSFNKKWMDDGTAASVAKRKDAITQGITFYLWRYPVNTGIGSGAPVTKDARQYTIRLSENDAGSETDPVIAFGLSRFSSEDFPKYDEKGYEYVYYVTEVTDSELYKPVYWNGDESAYDGSDTSERVVLNGGTLFNVRSARVAPGLTKNWDVSAVTDYSGSNCVFMLQRKEDGVWTDVESLSINGFTSSKKVIKRVFSPQDLYNNMGDRYEYRVIETAVRPGTGTDAVFDGMWAEEGSGGYSDHYEMNGYSYKSVSRYDEDPGEGGDTLEITVTDRLSGTKKLSLIKTWSGGRWDIGGDNSKINDVTFFLKRRIDGGSDSNYAKIIMKKPSGNEISGTGRVEISDKADPEGLSENSCSYTIGNDGKRWTCDKLTVPAYTDDGKQYIYSVYEDLNVPNDFNWTNEIVKNVTGKDITINVINHAGGTTSWRRIWIEKKWEDDSDNSQRSPVIAKLGKYEGGAFIQSVSSDGVSPDAPYEIELNSRNDYSGWLWVKASDLNDLGDNAALNEVLKGTAGGTDREMTGIRIDGDTVSGNISAVGESAGSYKPEYRVTIQKNKGSNGSLSGFTITNTRVAYRSFEFKKNWDDSEDALGYRGEFLRVTLCREGKDGVEKEIAYQDIPASSNHINICFTNGGENYPAYDVSGNNYIYTLKEYICKGTMSTSENTCDGINDERHPTTERKEVLTTATADTTRTGYVVKEATVNDNDRVENGKLIMNEKYEYTNTAAGIRNDVEFYCIWHDKAMSAQRPDIFFTLYYDATYGADPVPYPDRDDYTVRWVDVVSGNKFIQKAIFSGVPAADENGRVYNYYVAETLNNDVIGYSVDHYTESLFRDRSEAEYNTDVVTVSSGQIIVTIPESQRSKQNAANSGPELIKEKSFAVCTISGTVHIEGRKLWQNIPDGISANKLPKAYIYLFRESDYDKTNKEPAVSSNETEEVKEAAYIHAAVSGNDLDGSSSPRFLNAAKAMYIFGTYESDGIRPKEYYEFPKYDSIGGAPYKYTVREIIKNDLENPHELPAEMMMPHYSDNITDLSNDYKLHAETNRRSFKINKVWNVDRLLTDKSDDNAQATFRLYRKELNSDGHGYTVNNYAENDTDETDVASSKAAAANFSLNDQNLELLDEKILKAPKTVISWNNYPIFAPSGCLYAYYAVEMTGDMPGYTVSVNETSSGVNAVNTKVESGNPGEQGAFIGVAFANKNVTLLDKSEIANLKEETFTNSYRKDGFLKLKFSKEWDNVDGFRTDDSAMLPNGSDEGDLARRALRFDISAEAGKQSSVKDNRDHVTFTEGGNNGYTVTVDTSDPKKWEYTISFNKPVPIYSANGNPYTYTVKEILNSEFVRANYKPVTESISKEAKYAYAEGNDNEHRILTVGTLKNSLKGTFSVSKRWDDFSNDYLMREGSVRFTLQRCLGDSGNFEDCGEPYYELNSGGWTITFDKLPVTSNVNGSVGQYYQYRIKEKSIVSNGTEMDIDYPPGYADYPQNEQWRPNGTSVADSDSFCKAVSSGNYKVYNPSDIGSLSSNVNKKIVNQLDTEGAVVSLKVIKNWENDEGYKRDLRPGTISVEIQKSRDGNNWERVVERTISRATQTQTNENRWEYTFTNLPKYYGTSTNDIYMYRAMEVEVGDARAISENGMTTRGGAYAISQNTVTKSNARNEVEGYETTITNRLIERENPIIVTKVWNDDEPDHENVRVALYSNNFVNGTTASGIVSGVKHETSLTMSQITGSEKTLQDIRLTENYNGLPKYNMAGNTIIYYVKEIDAGTAGDYKTQYTSRTGTDPFNTESDLLPHSSESSDGTFEVKIINTPLISVRGSKDWNDDRDAFSLRPDNITLTLQRRTPGTSGTGSWTDVTLGDLKKTNTSSGITGSDSDPVTKDMAASDSWRDVTIEKLPLYVLEGYAAPQKYQYRFEEKDVPDAYTLKSDGTAGTASLDEGYTYTSGNGVQNSTVTNKLIRRGDINVTKIWNSNIDSEKDPVTVSIYSRNAQTEPAAGTGAVTKVSGITADRELNGTNGWTTTYTNLPLKNKDGQEIVYYVSENAGINYSTVYEVGGVRTPVENVTASSGGSATSIRVINTPYTSATVRKEWRDDSGDRYKTRPSAIYVKLQRSEVAGTGSSAWTDVIWGDIPDSTGAQGKNAGDKVVLMLNNAGSWSDSLDKLPHFKDYSGSVIKYDYRFIECDIAGSPYVPNGYTLDPAVTDINLVTNTGDESGYSNTYDTEYHTVIKNYLITKKVRVRKTWEDLSDAMGIRPSDITLYVSENTSVPGSTGCFNEQALGGVNAAHPFGNTPLTFTMNGSGNVWTYEYSGLPKYPYGDNFTGSEEIKYLLTEDTETPDTNNFVMKNYYETEYDAAAPEDETRITNTVMANDGVIIIEKKIDSPGTDAGKEFEFNVEITKTNGDKELFAGRYHLYSTADIAGVTDSALREDAFRVNSAYTRRDVNASNGKVTVPDGMTAVLTDINSRYSYTVTEEASEYGYDVVEIEHHVYNGTTFNDKTCSVTDPRDPLSITGADPSSTEIKYDSDKTSFYGIAKGKVPGITLEPAKIVFTNKLFTVPSLKIENVTGGSSGGEVRTYKGNEIIDDEDKVNDDNRARDYSESHSGYVKNAVSVQFHPDTANGYTYGDSITVGWWESGDDLSTEEPPHTVIVTGYIREDASGNQVPYTGNVSAGGRRWQGVGGNTPESGYDTPSGNAPVSATDENLLNAWGELVENGPFTNITVLEGSVVLTLADDANHMPAKTVVQVSFKAPEAAPNPSAGNNGGSGGSTVDSGDQKPADNGKSSGSKKKKGTDAEDQTTGSGSAINNSAANGVLAQGSDSASGSDAVSGNIPGRGIRTGDDTPLKTLIMLFVGLLFAFAAVLIILLKKKKRKDG